MWLAKATGNPVVPFHLEASSHWTAKSWDAAQIPKPFSRVAIVVGEPIDVPPTQTTRHSSAYRRELEERLHGPAAAGRRALAVEALVTLTIVSTSAASPIT